MKIELYQTPESKRSALTKEIYEVRESVLFSNELNSAWIEELHSFGDGLKMRSKEKFGKSVHKGIPEWEALTGGSEDAQEVTEEEKAFVITEIYNFLQTFKARYNI